MSSHPDVAWLIGIGFLGKIMSFDSKFRPKNLKNIVGAKTK
jgi:hypothetical protein